MTRYKRFDMKLIVFKFKMGETSMVLKLGLPNIMMSPQLSWPRSVKLVESHGERVNHGMGLYLKMF